MLISALATQGGRLGPFRAGHFTSYLFRKWIPNSARHRRWTPMIQRGRARPTISAGSWFELWSPAPPPSSATAALSAPDRWHVTWRPPLSRMAGPADPRRTSPRASARRLETFGRPNGGVGRSCPNQRNKSERKENMRQPQLCSMPAAGRSRPDRLLIFAGARGYPTEKSSKNPHARAPKLHERHPTSAARRSRPGRINEQKRRRAVNLGATRSLHEGRIVARKSSQEPKSCTRSTKSARHYPGEGCLPRVDRGE